ncbi:unnamed protein product [Pieris brassicae]|uniref:Uncharacterized protein n=1 Tax=Pieris brassicae TaxID=7116 RepID=A0A9P0X9Y4_PIEBR|nr:unnamed protein product [Pieris brassicae]
MTAVVSCIVTTLIFMLGIGVGLGYNYCYVDFTSGQRASADAFDSFEDLMVIPVNDTESDDRSSKGSRKSFQPFDLPIKKNVKISVPLNEGIDFTKLLNKIRSSRKNVTLQLIV